MDTPLQKRGKGGFRTGIFKVGEEGELFLFPFFFVGVGGWVGWGGGWVLGLSQVWRDLNPVGHPKSTLEELVFRRSLIKIMSYWAKEWSWVWCLVFRRSLSESQSVEHKSVLSILNNSFIHRTANMIIWKWDSIGECSARFMFLKLSPNIIRRAISFAHWLQRYHS